MQHLDIATHTGMDYYQYMRDICSWKLLQNPVQLGGPQKEVEINESLLVKAKYFRRRGVHNQDCWIFGTYDVLAKTGYITFVSKRDAATLLPIKERVVAPGSVITSDVQGNYTHRTINHSRNFVDPVSGATTNHVESYWKRAKSIFKGMNGTQKHMLPSYLDKFMWLEHFGQTHNLCFINILVYISERYPC